jgi:hypothetical protein
MNPTKAVSTAIGSAVAVLAVLLAAPPAAAGPSVTPDVPNLPAGALPHLPYVNWVAKQIVDGSRRVSISGIQGKVWSLHKVDGGYLLVRVLGDFDQRWDLVFVSNAGARRAILVGMYPPRPDALDVDNKLAVSRDGDKVLVNTATVTDSEPTYRDTRVVSLPAGQVLRTRDFGFYAPELLGFGVDRAMLTIGSESQTPPSGFWPDTKWWNPATNAVTDLRDDATGESADLSAWQWAVRPQVGAYSVEGIPPDTEPDWPVAQEDFRFGPWSLDDQRLAGNNEVTDDANEASAYVVYRTSDGAHLLSVIGNQPPRVVWETDSALLMRTRIEGTSRTYQLIRCTLSGSCSRVGPSTNYVRGGLIPATRRNS